MRKKLLGFYLSVFASCLMIFSSQTCAWGQARIVFGTTSDAFIVMSSNAVVNGNPIYLVVGDATVSGVAANTITRTSNGAILSNGEKNILRWYIGSTVANYTVPWAYSTTNYIPLGMNKTNASTASAYFDFATYRTPSWNNELYKPQGVGTCHSPACNCDASPWMVDRFWLIDQSSYSGTLPTVDLTFTYVDGGAGNPEVFSAGNTLTGLEANLEAESYNNAAGMWAGNTYGTDNTGTNTVGAPNNSIPAVKLFKWWTLVEKAHPLPVTWLDLSSDCDGHDVVIKWSTASEQNADYFTVERSLDGITYSPLATVPASGNSTTVKDYSYTDTDAPSITSYYRLRETDYNGEFSFSAQIPVAGCGTKNQMGVYPNPSLGTFNVAITGSKDEEIVIVVVDMLGQEFYSKVTVLSSEEEVIAIDPTSKLAAGVYTVIATSKEEIIKKKIVIQ
jgi:hypothetical protein